MRALAYLNRFIFKYKWRLLLGIVFIVISNIFAIMGPEVVKEAMDFLEETISNPNAESGDEYMATIVKAGLGFMLLFVLYAVCKGFFLFLTRQTIIIMSRFIEFDLKNEIFQHYQRLSLSFYRRNNTGDLMNRISEDVSKVRMYLGPAIMYTLSLIVLFILCIGAMLRVNQELTLFVLLPLPVLSILIYHISNIINKKSERVQRQQSRLSTFAQEAFSGIRVLKAYNQQARSEEEFTRESEVYREHSLSLVKTNALFWPLMIILIGASTILTIYIGGLKVIETSAWATGTPGKVTYGNLAQFVIYVNMLTWPFASVGWVTSLVQRAAASQERINEFMKEQPDIVNTNHQPEEVAGHVEFRNVSFTYPDSGIEALKNVSFKIEQGKTLAVIGTTGSGKSTIAQLICRSYDATKGEVLIDGIPIRERNLSAVRSAIGYVPQDVFLFSDTVADNIAFGEKQRAKDMKAVTNAAKEACIHDSISSFAKGYETVVGERGITLSGGQKQRISIARAIIKAPQILIFDDCLSAVDLETEEKILNNLQRIMANKTTLLISHRIATVKNADHIIVLDEGRITEEGSHDNLLKTNGKYRILFDKQQLEAQKELP